MDESPHVLMVGPGAETYVRDHGGATVELGYFRFGGANFDDVPLPDDIAVVPPGAEIPAQKAAFSGAWAGTWFGVLNHILVVEQVQSEGAEVVYALGPGSDLDDPFFQRHRVSFESDELIVTQEGKGGNWIVTYRLMTDDRLQVTAVHDSDQRRYETTLRRWRIAEKKSGGTVGAVALDRCGDLAAGTSTGGFGSKTPGRVGDSPIIGAGTYADNATAAISATGHGEFFIRYAVAHDIVAFMEYTGATLVEAATYAIKDKGPANGLRGGVIAVDKDGQVAMVTNTAGMLRGVTSNRIDPKVQAY